MAPSMRWKARSRPPASHTAIFILAPIWFAFSVAPAILQLTSARVRVMRSIPFSQELTRMRALVEAPGGLVAQILLQRNAARRSRLARLGGPSAITSCAEHQAGRDFRSFWC